VGRRSPRWSCVRNSSPRPGRPTTAAPDGGQPRWNAAGFDGAIWHSRQAALHRQRVEQVGGLAKLALTHAAVEVLVYWSRPGDDLLAPGGSGPDPLLHADAAPDRLVVELAALLGLHVELDRIPLLDGQEDVWAAWVPAAEHVRNSGRNRARKHRHAPLRTAQLMPRSGSAMPMDPPVPAIA
jgi:hypothetical protein